MILFRKKQHPLLEKKLQELEMDMSNNYKDNAQDDFHDLEESFRLLKESGKLSERQKQYYGERIEEFRTILTGYTHKDQKAVW